MRYSYNYVQESKKPSRNYRIEKKKTVSSVTQSRLTHWDPIDCNTPGLPVLHQLPEFTQTHVPWVSDAIQPSHPLSSHLLLPSTFPSIGVFSNESALCIRYWSFSFNISPSNEYSGLISFRIDWLDLVAVQGTLKCLLQHHSTKALILRCWVFFIVQLSHSYMTTGKTIALTRQTFVGKIMSLLFNKLSQWIWVTLGLTFIMRPHFPKNHFVTSSRSSYWLHCIAQDLVYVWFALWHLLS